VSLRARLTLLYIVLVAITLAVFSLVAYVVAGERVGGGINDSLQARADTIDGSLGDFGVPLTQATIRQDRTQLESQVPPNVLYEILAPDGSVLFPFAQLPNRVFPAPEASAPEQATYFDSKVSGQKFRFLYHPVVRDGQTVAALEVGQSLKETDEAMSELRNVLIFVGLAVLVLTSGSAYALSSRALRPIRDVSKLARNIQATADFSRRLPGLPSGAEMRELVSTFNSMIERVEQTLLSQRAFLADSSHELRRPLTLLRTDLDLLNDPNLPAEEREACLEEMSAAATSMSRLLSDLLLISREEAQSFSQSVVNYSDLCEEAASRFAGRDGAHVIGRQLEPGLTVVGDKERLTQMLWNLLENASAYTPQGGDILLKLQHQNGSACLQVEDHGIGIPQQSLHHVFERFYRTDEARNLRSDGNGLGLTIVKYIAEAHKGSVQASSQEGMGSVFTVTLPLALKTDASA